MTSIQLLRRPALRAGITASLLLALACQARTAEQPAPALLYYQVTYDDGSVRDLDQPPDTNQNIRDVTRIARYQPPGKSAVILATGMGPAMTVVNEGKTVRRQMQWTGRAWALPTPQTAPATQPAEADRKARDADIQALKEQLLRQLRRQAELDQQVQRARDALVAAQADAGQARDELTRLQAQRKAAEDAVEATSRLLEALLDCAGMDHPTGKVTATQPAAAPGGEVSPVVKAAAYPPHRIQVWKRTSQDGPHTWQVSMPHVEAGEGGAFYYVAYADTDGDGTPDKLIGHSPLAQAEQPGQWTSWSFTTDLPVVYIGNAWPLADSAIYYQAAQGAAGPDAPAPGDGSGPLPGPRDGTTDALDAGAGEIFVSGWFGGIPWRRCSWPFWTNVHIRLADGPGQGPSPATGSQIIVR